MYSISLSSLSRTCYMSDVPFDSNKVILKIIKNRIEHKNNNFKSVLSFSNEILEISSYYYAQFLLLYNNSKSVIYSSDLIHEYKVIEIQSKSVLICKVFCIIAIYDKNRNRFEKR